MSAGTKEPSEDGRLPSHLLLVIHCHGVSLNSSNGQICTHVGGCRPQSSNSISQSLPQNTLPTNRMIDGEYCNTLG